jgi:LmbE family N-acetylglucosaminyl deacetylase
MGERMNYRVRRPTARARAALRLAPRLALALALLAACVLVDAAPAVAQEHGRRLVAVFSHPDDERIVGPLLARYAREGNQVYLVIATDGRKGIRQHAGIPAGDSLAIVREKEARCATDRLGIAPPVLLGLEDAGLASFAALGQLRQKLEEVLRELKPDALISFGPEGGTGHPDHRLVGDVVTELVQRGTEGAPERLYYPSLPAERMASAPAARPTISTMRARLLSVQVAFEPQDLEKTRAAFACHASQYTAEEMAAVMRYLEHGFAGAVHLRPWLAQSGSRTDLFDQDLEPHERQRRLLMPLFD